MDKMACRRKAKGMLALWIISIIPVYVYSGYRKFIYVDTNEPADLYTVVLLALIAFYYLPLLLCIHKYAKLGELIGLTKFTKVFIFLFGGVLAIAPFAFVLMYIKF